MFVIQHLGCMKILVKYPVMVRVDNVCAIIMASNITTTCCTKYVNEYIENGVVKIIFVQSAENNSKILTKNLSVELHEKHLKKMAGENS